MPPKPAFTYAQLIHRAIKDLGGKGTLQQICTWIMNTYEYYRYADSTAWMVSYYTFYSAVIDTYPQSSVRHNLSSNRAFRKMERCGGDRGKGFFWSLDEVYSQSLEEQEQKAKQAAAATMNQGTPFGSAESATKSRKKEKGAFLEPPLKRSIKGDMKGVPLPPPLTSSPLPFKTTQSPIPPLSATTSIVTSTPISQAHASKTISTATTATTGVFAYPSHPQNMQTLPRPTSAMTSTYPNKTLSGANPYAPLAQSNWAMHAKVIAAGSGSPPINSNTTPIATSPITSPPPAQPSQTAVPDVVIPIILGPIPPTHPDYAPNQRNNSAKEGYMILHERKLILDPDIFAELTKEMLEKLEAMGARGALQVLTEHMIRALKERRARERGKERGGRRPRGAGRGGARKGGPVTTAPFTNVPLEHKRKAPGADPAIPVDSANANDAEDGIAMKPPSPNQPPAPAPVPLEQKESGPPPGDPGSPLIVVDDVSEDEGPASKKRKLDTGESFNAS